MAGLRSNDSIPAARTSMTPITHLFVPATRTDRIAKAFDAGAHAVIVDLEDAVAEHDKPGARAQLAYFLSSSTTPVWLRVNSVLAAGFADDLALVRTFSTRLSGVMLAKAESCANIDALRIDASPGLPVIALIETARGMLSLGDICAHPLVTRLAFGSIDLARDLGCDDDWDVLAPARLQLVLQSTAAGLYPPIDGVTLALDEPQAVTRDAARAARIGFGGKLCVHPFQLRPALEGFAPLESQLAWAMQVLALSVAGSGAQRLNGQMVDRPVIDRAQQIVQRHKAAGVLAPTSV